MLTPAYKIRIGSKVVDTTDEPQASTAVALAVALDDLEEQTSGVYTRQNVPPGEYRVSLFRK